MPALRGKFIEKDLGVGILHIADHQLFVLVKNHTFTPTSLFLFEF
jgi:hypothetical protein